MHTEYVPIANQLRIYGPIEPGTIIFNENIKHIVFDCSYETIANTCNNPEFEKIQTSTLIDVFIRKYDMNACLAAATVLKSYKEKHKIIIHDLVLYLIVRRNNNFYNFNIHLHDDIENIKLYALQVKKNNCILNKTDVIFEPWYFKNTNFEQQKINPITKKRFQTEYSINKTEQPPHVFLKEMTIDTLEDTKNLEKLGSYEHVYIDYIIGHRGLQEMCNILLATECTFSIMKRLVIGTTFSPSSYMNAKSVELVKQVQMCCLDPDLDIVFNDPNMECIFKENYKDIKIESVYKELRKNNVCYLQGYCTYFVPINVSQIQFYHSEIISILQNVFIQYNKLENEHWKGHLHSALVQLLKLYQSWLIHQKKIEAKKQAEEEAKKNRKRGTKAALQVLKSNTLYPEFFFELCDLIQKALRNQHDQAEVQINLLKECYNKIFEENEKQLVNDNGNVQHEEEEEVEQQDQLEEEEVDQNGSQELHSMQKES
jgi:hypothetical protein